MPPYEHYAAWQHCHQLVLMVYEQTRHWPRHEMFGLTSQVRRAAVSASSNLVEGAAKEGARQFRYHLDVAKGSLAELGYQIRLARDLEYLKSGDWQSLETQRDEAARSLWGLYVAIRRRARST